MKDLSELYGNSGKPKAAPAANTDSPEKKDEQPARDDAADKSPAAKKEQAQTLATPPGLPQEYIDANLLESEIPSVDELSIEDAINDANKPKNIRVEVGKPTLMHVDRIPYTPGHEGRLVRDRIAQGPHVFRSRAEKERIQRELHETKETKKGNPPQVVHPDTSKPGRFIKDESQVYRPGA